MKVVSIRAIKRNIPLVKPFRFASCTLSELPYAWVRIQTDNDLVGYGECPTYWDPSGETQDAAIGALKHFAPTVLGMNPVNLEDIFTKFDSELYGAFAAKCGLDMALYDIIGQRLCVPVHDLVGGHSFDVPVNAVIPLISKENTKDDIEKMVSELVNDGYKIFKIKAGVDIKSELSTICILKEKLPSDGKIFVDANQGWRDSKTALRAIHQLEEIGVVWVEQPIVAHDYSGLRLIRERSKASIIVDESLYSPYDAISILRENAADIFNIKLAKCGGMYLGNKLYSIAQAANIPCLLGSMIESSLGMLANYHFARSHQMESCGLSAYYYVKDRIDVGLKIENGYLNKTEENPGLGYPSAELFEEAFKNEP